MLIEIGDKQFFSNNEKQRRMGLLGFTSRPTDAASGADERSTPSITERKKKSTFPAQLL